MKKTLLICTLGLLLCGAVYIQNTEAAFSSKNTAHEQNEEHPHRGLGEDVIKSLIEKGYSKKEIFIAAHIAKFSEKKVDDVLSFYKSNDSSWEKTAKHYGVDIEKMKQHHQKKHHFLEVHKAEVIQTLTKYTGKPEKEIQTWLDDGISLHFIVASAALAKVSNKDLNEIIEQKKQKQSFEVIKNKLNIQDEQLYREMKNLMGEIRKSIKE